MDAGALGTRVGDGPPRLVLRFAALTALGLGLASAAIVLLMRNESTQQAQRHAIAHLSFAAEAMAQRDLRASDVRSPLAPRRRQELNRLLQENVLVGDIVSAGVYASGARLVHSTGTQAAVSPSVREHVRDAARGTVLSEVVRSGGRSFLRTYVPVALGRDGRAVVVFEQDYASIAAASRRETWLIAAVLEGLLVVLFLVLAPVLARVTRRIRQQIVEIEHAATHDELTGLPNRVWLLRAIERRLASRKPGALVLIDVQGFSEINQVFGSTVGDRVLREVATRFATELSTSASLTRFGEDEFAVLHLGPARQLEGVAERVRQQLATPIVVHGTRLRVHVSLGGAQLDGAVGTAPEAVRRASAALAVAKEEGTDELRMFQPSHDERQVSTAALAAELEDALERGELLLHYQPLADLATGQIRGVEALVRWRHPTRGLLSAQAFIREAEQSGSATAIRRRVLEEACRQWCEWRRLGIDLELAVNLSPSDLHDAGLADEIDELLDRYDLPPQRLVLELTERTAISDDPPVRNAVSDLARMDVRLAIDDFGTGYSSLASLRRLPLQVVKLDRSLLTDVPGDPAAEAVVTGCVTLAHAMGAVVVVEGIEDEGQWAFARSAGCDIGQGYFVGRPASGDDLSAMLLPAPAVTSARAA